MRTASDQLSEPLLRLRVLVSILGGAGHAGWWRTAFLTDAGLRFLERLYPRTSLGAAVHATAVAARAVHDSSIGRGEVFHLFRLPRVLEDRVRLLEEDGLLESVVRGLTPCLEAREVLLAEFERVSGELSETPPGPQRIGSLSDLQRGRSAVGKWAGAYAHAFRREYRVFPYVDAEGV